MSRSSWTPGPWRVADEDGSVGSIEDADGQSVAQAQERIEDRDRLGNRGPPVARRANARLIAAAPDLYRAAELARVVVEQAVGAGWLGDDDMTDRIALDAIDAALAKARGGR